MTESIYTPRQLEIIAGKIPDSDIITAEYTRILKWAREAGDDDVVAKIQPLRDERQKRRNAKQQKCVTKYSANHYDRIPVTLPKGYRDLIHEAAEKENTSMNRFILAAICDRAGIPTPSIKA